MFRLHIDQDLCKGCGICIEFCPKKVYDFSESIGAKGVKYPVPVRESECIGCQLCEIMCPDMAIDVENDNSEGP